MKLIATTSVTKNNTALINAIAAIFAADKRNPAKQPEGGCRWETSCKKQFMEIIPEGDCFKVTYSMPRSEMRRGCSVANLIRIWLLALQEAGELEIEEYYPLFEREENHEWFQVNKERDLAKSIPWGCDEETGEEIELSLENQPAGVFLTLALQDWSFVVNPIRKRFYIDMNWLKKLAESGATPLPTMSAEELAWKEKVEKYTATVKSLSSAEELKQELKHYPLEIGLQAILGRTALQRLIKETDFDIPFVETWGVGFCSTAMHWKDPVYGRQTLDYRSLGKILELWEKFYPTPSETSSTLEEDDDFVEDYAE